MWAFGALPAVGANQNLAVFLAFTAMKFVDRHGRRIANPRRELKGGVKGEGRNPKTET